MADADALGNGCREARLFDGALGFPARIGTDLSVRVFVAWHANHRAHRPRWNPACGPMDAVCGQATRFAGRGCVAILGTADALLAGRKRRVSALLVPGGCVSLGDGDV